MSILYKFTGVFFPKMMRDLHLLVTVRGQVTTIDRAASSMWLCLKSNDSPLFGAVCTLVSNIAHESKFKILLPHADVIF